MMNRWTESAAEALTESDFSMASPPTTPEQVRPGITITGPFIPEAMEVLAIVPFGTALKVIGRGTKTGRSYDPVLSPEQIAQLKISGEAEPFDGSALHFRIGVEAHRLGLAYEYDPSISWISRVDDARESLLRSRWDLIIVDEAHKMAPMPATRRRSPISSASIFPK